MYENQHMWKFPDRYSCEEKKVMENNSHASLCVFSVSFSLDLALIVYVEEGVSLGFTVLSQHNSQI